MNRPIRAEDQRHLLTIVGVQVELNLPFLVVIVHYVEDDSWYLLHFGQLPACVLIVAQVLLVSDQDDGNVGTEVFDLWGPLLRNVFCEGKDQEKIYYPGRAGQR